MGNVAAVCTHYPTNQVMGKDLDYGNKGTTNTSQITEVSPSAYEKSIYIK